MVSSRAPWKKELVDRGLAHGRLFRNGFHLCGTEAFSGEDFLSGYQDAGTTRVIHDSDSCVIGSEIFDLFELLFEFGKL